MTTLDVFQLCRESLLAALLLSLPAVAASLVIGLTVGVLQTLTSLQEQTLSFVPKILGVALVLMLSMPWLLRTSLAFAERMFLHAVEFSR